MPADWFVPLDPPKFWKQPASAPEAIIDCFTHRRTIPLVYDDAENTRPADRQVESMKTEKPFR
jgi:hypothetical protein